MYSRLPSDLCSQKKTELLIHLPSPLQYWDYRLTFITPGLRDDRDESQGSLQLGMRCTNQATSPAQDQHFANICLSQH